MAGLATQWFPVYPSEQGVFLLDGQPSSRATSVAEVSIDLDTFPTLLYGVRWTTSYELPPTFFQANPAFKRDMRLGGVDDDYDVTVQFTQGNVTVQRPAHVRNMQGGVDVNKHPFPVPYPLRGGNRIIITARRNSSYPPVIVADVEVPITIVLKVSLETARGIRNAADGIETPAPPPTTGFP